MRTLTLIERVAFAANIVEKHHLHLPLSAMLRVLARPRHEHAAFAFEFLDRGCHAGPGLAEFLDGEAACGRVAAEEDEEVGFRVQDKVGLRGAGGVCDHGRCSMHEVLIAGCQRGWVSPSGGRWTTAGASPHLVADEAGPFVEADSLVLPESVLELWVREEGLYAAADGEVFEADRGVVLLQERDGDRELRLPVPPDCGRVHLWPVKSAGRRCRAGGGGARRGEHPAEAELDDDLTQTPFSCLQRTTHTSVYVRKIILGAA